MTTLIQRYYNLDFKSALERAISMLGLSREQLQLPTQPKARAKTQDFASVQKNIYQKIKQNNFNKR